MVSVQNNLEIKLQNDIKSILIDFKDNMFKFDILDISIRLVND